MRYTKAALALALFAFTTTATSAESLSIERIFAAPDLSGPMLRDPKISSDGRYVTYLQGKPDNKDQLDLWAFDVRTGSSKLLVDSRAFVSGEERLSAEEEARRERQRTASLRGIVEYEFSSDGRLLLVPLGGDLYTYDINARANPVRRLTSTEAYETDARFSPKARYISFVRDQDLFVIDLRDSKEQAITSDGEGLIQNGVAEFIAQEEMGRNTGYWWSPDEAHIAYARIDDSTVQETERFEINADGAQLIRQRYPAAGTANTRVQLKLVELAAKRTTDIHWNVAEDDYLARLSWFPDSQRFAVQRQSRDQKRLDLVRFDVRSGQSKVLLTERSDHWVTLHDDLRFLKKQAGFVWASRRSGYAHLYLYDLEGNLQRPLTQGDWMVVGNGDDGIVGIDEAAGRIYFLANKDSVLERHLYVTDLKTTRPSESQPGESQTSESQTGEPRRITREAGWHDARLVPGGASYLDVWSSPQQPTSVSIRSMDGKRTRWLVRNSLDDSHPYQPFMSAHVAEEFGSIPASDGQALRYRLLKPAKMQPGVRYPVVFDLYGGPGNQYIRKDWMGGARAPQGYFRQLLAQRGFVVFSLDNRGSGSRGVAFETALAGQFGKVEVADQLRGVDFLKSQSYVDAGRIGIMGWSYGGYMTLKAMTSSTAFKAGVAGAPVTDWSLYDTHYTERYLATPQANANGYKESGVLAHLDALHGSLLMVHGMADDNVLFTHSTMLMQQLQKLDKPFDLMTYPGGKHGLIRAPVTGPHFYEMVLRFFERELK